jgi:hypothetical protein
VPYHVLKHFLISTACITYFSFVLVQSLSSKFYEVEGSFPHRERKGLCVKSLSVVFDFSDFLLRDGGCVS